MSEKINILIVEDSADDAELVLAELRRAGIEPEWQRVETEPDFVAALKQSPDIILSDFSMPQFSGFQALGLLQASGRDIPFILISGTMGEETAVEAMKRGAVDYLLKDRIVRVGAAVRSALEQKKLRLEHEKLKREIIMREQQLNAFFSGATAGLALLDRELRYLQINETLAEMNGLPAAAHLGRTVREVLPQFAPLVEPFFQKVLATGESVLNVEVSGEKPNQPGVLRHWVESIFPIVGKGGMPNGFGVIVVETTERKHAEEALRAGEERFRQFAENINEVFWITNPAGEEIIYVSPAYETIWGRTCANLLEMPATWLEAIHPEDRERIAQAMRTKQVRGEYNETYRILRPDGALRWIHDRAFPLRNPAGEVYRIVGTAEDITENRRLEEQFRQSQKMEAIGQLAGGVAHDFNNMLAVIQMQAGLLKDEENLSADQFEAATEIEKAAERATNLTRQLLMFSRRQAMQFRLHDLSEIVASIHRMLQRVLGEDVLIEFDYAAEPLFIRADSGMMDQVLMNLTVNARDAMPDGGRLTIETSAVELDEMAAAQLPSARPGSFVCLSVSDSGCGMPPEIVSHIFEPFFTTKGVGKGTGLGLATVFGIMQQHRGWINIQSEVGKGSTFRIYLPREAEPMEVAAALPMSAPAQHGKETILLAEDDASLRGSIGKALTRLGYRVLEAATGLNALELWRQNRNEIRLLITDMVMPDGMNGKELAQRLHREDPQLKVIYTSGYSTDFANKNLHLDAHINFLAKPFDVSKLAQTVAEVLAG
jgi:PAS domain S-box-containing protein